MAQKLAMRTTVPIASIALVLPPVPFHSPVNTPMTVENRIVDAITIANEMYLRSPISGSPAFWQTNWNTHMTPTSEANTQFLSRGTPPRK